MSVPKYITLAGGDKMPRLGFGTWQASESEVEDAVTAALEAGYRHIDTAAAYENEKAIGRALNRWIGNDPDRRKELFVVTKLPPSGNSVKHVEEFFAASLANLGLEYLDLYLIHTPFGFEYVPGDLHPKNPDGSMKFDFTTDLMAVWKELIKIKESGRVRHIGVSNMNEEQINRFTKLYKPECLQIEINVTCQQTSLVAEAKRLGIPVVAYSPLGSRAMAQVLAAKTGREYPNLLELPEVKSIATAHSRSSAQILLRYLLQCGVAAIPKSTSPKRIKENISVWDLELSDSEMAALRALDRGDDGRICDFSFFPGVEKHPEFPFKRH
ncbi:aldose reductase-related protein 2-like [Aricia agestis]|uniref:aldose reductase-related protein 2-like n=1 Tax=Aricia agestis TaxID=91739 RepID=UPI001C206042|nr:aldose reductase-related protein 2-like [Aricia agestis]